MSGRVTGLRARGGFTVDLQWEAQVFQTARIRSLREGTCRVRIKQLAPSVQAIAVFDGGGLVAQVPAGDSMVEFQTQPGGEYWLKPVYSASKRKINTGTEG